MVALAGLLAVGCNSDKRRYELACSPFSINGNTYIGMRVLDTYTGDVWVYTGIYKSQDSNWTFAGNPAQHSIDVNGKK